MAKTEHSSLQIGQRVDGEIYKILPHALLLRLNGGEHGVLRQREVSWDNERPNLEKLFKVGDRVRAVVVKVSKEENSVELSLRLIHRDPWDDFVKTHHVGDVVSGIVRGVRKFGAFVKITNGVDGLVPVSEIRYGERVEKAQDVLWVGDEVRAIIQEIDPQQRHVRLSIKTYLDTLASKIKRPVEKEISLQDFLDPATRRYFRQVMGDIPEETLTFEPKRIQRVLIADDHHSFRESLAQTLRDWGYIVLEVENLQAVREILDASFDLIILDYHLSDGSTIDLAREIVQKQSDVVLLLLTGFELDDAELEKARSSGFTIEYKPFGPADLVEFLQKVESQDKTVTVVQSEPQSPEEKDEWTPEYKVNDVERFLEQLAVKVGAKGAIVFQASTENRWEIEWPYIVGLEISNPEAHITLQYSPVGDVLFGRKWVMISDVVGHPARSKYLLQAINFRSCVGIPVPVTHTSGNYALFVFFEHLHTFSKVEQDKWWRKQAELLAYQIDREQVSHLFIQTQGDLLRSQLRAGALHEVRNSIGALEHVLGNLIRKLDGWDVALPVTAQVLEDFRTSILEAQAFTRQIKKTAELFRELGLSTKPELISVNDIVRRSVERQSPLAGHLAVTLDFQPDNDLPATFLRPAHLQQAVENVILNAIQWCADRRIRQVNVRTAYHSHEEKFPIQIVVADTGPGIHRQLQSQRIFEMGYSTRKNGSGLGLFVARILLESMGGNIRVTHSIMEVGTTFVIELPLCKKVG